MSAAARGASFAIILIAVFAVASLAGAEINPRVDTPPQHEEGPDTRTHSAEAAGDGHSAPGDDAPEGTVPGLASADAGYRLLPERTRFHASGSATLAFRIAGPDGETVRDFDIEHERPMHLILVRRDFADFQHLHPKQRADGGWEVEADLAHAGTYRAFADFATDGMSLTLAADLFVAGEFEPRPLPEPRTIADAGDGYEVEIIGAPPRPGRDTAVEFAVSRGGRAVHDVEPYLGADGHLVALREHDQAYLHTHPQGEPGGSGPISFRVSYPTAGSYRLFLQFKHRGRVRTAAFTQVVGTGGGDAHVGDEEHTEDPHGAG